MKTLAAYIMRGPAQAVLVAAVTALLSLLLPPFSYVSGAAVGLVTLTLGMRRGLMVGFWAGVAAGVFAQFALGNPLPGVLFVVMVWLPVVLVAGRLRRSVALEQSILLAVLIGAAVVIAMHVGLGDPTQWWRHTLHQMLKKTADAPHHKEVVAAVDAIARYLTGAMAAALVLGMLGSLFIARWWQAMLYNPGGFREEFHRLRLGRLPSLVAVVLLAAAFIVPGRGGAVAVDLLIVAAVVFMLQGLAVAHGLVGSARAHVGWLVMIYVLLVFAMRETVITLAVAGLVDNWFDFRVLFENRGK